MKKVFVFAISMLVVLSFSFAQDGKTALKTATKALGSYRLNTTDNVAKLAEAKTAADQAVLASDVNGLPAAWLVKGDIYNEIISKVLLFNQTGLGSLDGIPTDGNASNEAANAYLKALEVSVKGGDKSKAIKGLLATEANLNGQGVMFYEKSDYKSALVCFETGVKIKEALNANKEKSILDPESEWNNQNYLVGLAALNAGEMGKAEKAFTFLREQKFDKPAIYEALYKIDLDKCTGGSEDAEKVKVCAEKAYPVLEEGRKRFPEDITLLFADINHFLKLGKMEVLINKMEEAIAKEPDNLSLYTTMGSIYDNMYQKAAESKETEKADGYFNKALDYFKQSLAKNADNFDANYAIGSLYYNKAAVKTQDMIALSNDYSKAAMKKYDEIKKEVFEQFDIALPYFQACEKLNPNDTNTLIALREMYAKKEKLDLSAEFKKRLENVQGGGKNESYFKKN